MADLNAWKELDGLLKSSNKRDIEDAMQYEDIADVVATLRQLKKRRSRLSQGRKEPVSRARKVHIRQGIAAAVQKFQAEKNGKLERGA